MSETSLISDYSEVAALDRSSRLRERLLSAAARASRALLEAPNAMLVMPAILRELGEAAEVDRSAFAIAETDADGTRWLVIKSEWTAEFVIGERSSTQRVPIDERKSDCFCTQLSTGRSVYLRPSDDRRGISITSELAKSSLIVPVLVDGEYAGALGFDNCHAERGFDKALVDSLEIAAGLVGAALHRERLIETMRMERERAAEERLAQLASSFTVLRTNLQRLATASDPYSYLGHVLIETAQQLQAVSGSIVMLSPDAAQWFVMAHVQDGQLAEPPYAKAMATDEAMRAELSNVSRDPLYLELRKLPKSKWPGMAEYQQREGLVSCYKMPLIFNDQVVGFITLAYRMAEPLCAQRSESLVALAQQATLAIGLKRLAISAKNAAVLAERNRIGQEIHDGLAQAFTGILMQLAAAEELVEGSPLAAFLSRIRDIARDGLAEARRSVVAMRAQESRPGGLELALQQLAERSTVEGRLRADFSGAGVATGLAPEHEHALLRIAQEAVSNAARHARAATISIGLTVEETCLELSVADDGCGVELGRDIEQTQGFGLTNMRERAVAIGGHWNIDTAPGQGTRISVRVPRQRQP